MPDKVLKVGVVGTGIWASKKHLPAYQSLPEKFIVTAAYNRSPEKLNAFASQARIAESAAHNQLEDILEDENVDVLDFLLPVEYNYEHIRKAIEVGKPVIIEKPLAHNLEDARKIVELTRRTHIPVAIAENWVYYRAIDELKSRLSEIGPIVSFNFRQVGSFPENNPYFATSWRKTPKHAGGFVSDGGVHQIALLTQVLGNVKSVSGHATQVRGESGAEDTLTALFKLESGVFGTYSFSLGIGKAKNDHGFTIYGKSGSLDLDLTDSHSPKILHFLKGSTNGAAEKDEIIKFSEDPTNGIVPEVENFYEAVINGDKSLIKASPEVAFHHLAVIIAALESSKRDGALVAVETV